MDLQGQKVVHPVFGAGKVTAHDGIYFTVAFDEGDKKFAYPDSFRQFLKMVDKEMAKAIKAELAGLDKLDAPSLYKSARPSTHKPPQTSVKSPAAKKTVKGKGTAATKKGR